MDREQLMKYLEGLTASDRERIARELEDCINSGEPPSEQLREYLETLAEYYFYSSESEMEDHCSSIASDEKPRWIIVGFQTEKSGDQTKRQATEPAEDWGEPACKYRKST